ncbi:hypothetical protein [Helicobacter mesocricetorum]|uniref:hypothetical protein n=1 Tax=Helicobacter mesocricetorum TaxID=87012 RepID=UPI0018F804F1|nr:hypothetical protein [Helicobacter mesocricetorum]
MRKIFLIGIIFSIALSQEPSAFNSGGSASEKSETKLINEKLFNLSAKIDSLDESQEGLKSVFDGQIQRIQDVANKINTMQSENNTVMTDIRNHVDTNFALQNENIENLKKSITALSELLAKNNAYLKEEIQGLKNEMHDLMSKETSKQENSITSNNIKDSNPTQKTDKQAPQNDKENNKQSKNGENKENLKQENLIASNNNPKDTGPNKQASQNEKQSEKQSENKENKENKENPKQENPIASNNTKDFNPTQKTDKQTPQNDKQSNKQNEKQSEKQDKKQNKNNESIASVDSKQDLENTIALNSKQDNSQDDNKNANADKAPKMQDDSKLVAKDKKESPKEKKDTQDTQREKILEELKNKELALVFKEGEEYLKAKKYELANEYLQFAVKGHYKPARGNYLLGEIAFAQKHYQDAIYYYKVSATRYDKADYMPNLMLNSAKSFINIKEKQNAKRFLETLIQLYPEAKEAEESKKILSNL